MESGWERDVKIHKGWDCVCLVVVVVVVVGVALIVALGVMGGDVGDGGETSMYRSGGGGDSVVHRSVGGGLCRSG